MRRSYAAYAAGAVAAAVSAVLAAPGGTVVGSAALRHGSQVAWLKEGSVALHPAPGSPQVSATIASRTEFGSRTSLPVVAARGEWLEVISTKLRNGVRRVHSARAGAADEDPDRDRRRPLRPPAACLAVRDRRASGRRGDRAAGSPTPIGHFGVTDKLTGLNPAAYGCCILALSAHQTHLPPGWAGGDRIAIHGGGGIGAATSNGCLHATTAVLRRLMRRVPLGTQVVVHP